MDERTEIFIALGAAAAANCDPCFEHYFLRAEKLGIDHESIKKTVEIAIKVRGGANMVMKAAVQRLMTCSNAPGESHRCQNGSTCCD